MREPSKVNMEVLMPTTPPNPLLKRYGGLPPIEWPTYKNCSEAPNNDGTERLREIFERIKPTNVIAISPNKVFPNKIERCRP